MELLLAIGILGMVASIGCMSLLMYGMATRRTQLHGVRLRRLAVILASAANAVLLVAIVLSAGTLSFLWFLIPLVLWGASAIALTLIAAFVVRPMRERRGWHVEPPHGFAVLRPRSLIESRPGAPILTATESVRLSEIEQTLGGWGLKLVFGEHEGGWQAHVLGPSGEDLDRTDSLSSLREAAEVIFERESRRDHPDATHLTSASSGTP